MHVSLAISIILEGVDAHSDMNKVREVYCICMHKHQNYYPLYHKHIHMAIFAMYSSGGCFTCMPQRMVPEVEHLKFEMLGLITF